MAFKPITQPVYVTKYGLTNGIMMFEVGEVGDNDTDDEHYFHVKWGRFGSVFAGRQHWTYDLDEAKTRVHQMVLKKMAAIKKQLTKLGQYVPDIVEPAKESR